MKSYESSKWYIKLWRMRWYIYALFLLLIHTFNPNIIIEIILHNKLYQDSEQKVKSTWQIIKRHVELSKMHKFSSKEDRTD